MNETLWHKYHSPIFPRRTVDGGWTEWVGQTWRRRVNDRWEYRQDEESGAEFYERQF